MHVYLRPPNSRTVLLLYHSTVTARVEIFVHRCLSFALMSESHSKGERNHGHRVINGVTARLILSPVTAKGDCRDLKGTSAGGPLHLPVTATRARFALERALFSSWSEKAFDCGH